MTSRTMFTAQIAKTSLRFCAPADMPLLRAAELAGTAGFHFQSSCRNGTCRTCMCRLVAGEVTYRIEWPGLSGDEKRDGFILPCVAYPVTDVLIEYAA